MTADLKALSRRVMAMNITNATPDPRTQRDAPLWRTLLLLGMYGAAISLILFAGVLG